MAKKKKATLLLKVTDSIKQLVRDNRFNVVNKRIHTESIAVINIYIIILYIILILYIIIFNFIK